MLTFFYNRYTMNILTFLLTAAFFVLPALILGVSYVIFSAIIVLLGSGLLFSTKVDPEQIDGISGLSPHYSGPLYRIVMNLADRAGLSKVPSIYISQQPVPNAAAVETREGPAIIVTGELLDRLEYDELEAVLAHEISHIRNNDIQLLSFLGRFRMLYTAIPRLLILMIFFIPILLVFLPFSPAFLAIGLSAILAIIIERAVMRIREYGADYGAARIIDNPVNLANALERLESGPVYINWFGRQVAVPREKAGEQGGISALFKSHPRTSSRIRFLKDLAKRKHVLRDGSSFSSVPR